MSLQHSHDLADDTPLAPRAERLAAALSLARAAATDIADDAPSDRFVIDVLSAADLAALAAAVRVTADPADLQHVAAEVEAWARDVAGDLFGNVDLFELAIFTVETIHRRAAGAPGTTRLAAAALVATVRLWGFALSLRGEPLAAFVRDVTCGALEPLVAREALRAASSSV